jgi:hypothetical protein
MEIAPLVIENREFVGLEEEDIQKLNQAETLKFEANPGFAGIAAAVETQYGPGEWGEHWVTVDDSGRRVYARVYSGELHVLAITSDGKIIRQFV